MARRRSYRGMVNLPGLSGFAPPSNVDGMDVLIGAAAGAAGAVVVRPFVAKLAAMLPAQVAPFVPALTSGAVGAALYYAQGRSKRASGHLVGALAVSASQAALEGLKMVAPGTFGDIVSLPLSSYGYGLLANEATSAIGPGAFQGLIVDEPVRAMNDYSAANLAQLAGYSFGDDASGVESMVA